MNNSALENWNTKIAKQLASEHDIVLTDEHWLVINTAREFFFKTHTSLAMRPLVKLLKQNFGPEKGNSIYLHKLFKNNPAKLIAKIAGLPPPVRCM